MERKKMKKVGKDYKHAIKALGSETKQDTIEEILKEFYKKFPAWWDEQGLVYGKPTVNGKWKFERQHDLPILIVNFIKQSLSKAIKGEREKCKKLCLDNFAEGQQYKDDYLKEKISEAIKEEREEIVKIIEGFPSFNHKGCDAILKEDILKAINNK